MTPQDHFMIAAPVAAGHEAALEALLATMTGLPGQADPANRLFPFGRFADLHVARFVILNDATLGDLPPADRVGLPVWLVFLGDCDGSADLLLAEFARNAGEGLRRIFAHCDGSPGGSDLLAWLRTRNLRAAAQYVNWVGRTVRQIHEEAALHAALRTALAAQDDPASPTALRDRLVAFQRERGPTLSPPAATPAGWTLRHALDLLGVPLALILLAPFLLIYAPVFLWQLRGRETTDAVIVPRPERAHVQRLAAVEDHEVSNAFSAVGSVKPGLFRVTILRFIFWVLGFSLRQIYTRGRLARVGTIHFARWVFLDNRRRLFFGSNYDGSLDSYMDDFINKVAFGLNLVFSNGVGYPRTRFLINGGARLELDFKAYLRRHQVPTQVWYKAYPGLTAADLATNTLIREGLEAPRMTDQQARRWLALI